LDIYIPVYIHTCIYKCGCPGTHTHTHTSAQVCRLYLCIFGGCLALYLCISIFGASLLPQPFFSRALSLSLSLSCSPSLSQVSQAINVLFASCFCFAFVRRVFVGVCVLVSVSVFVNLFHILPVYLLALPLPLHPFHALQPPAPPPSFRTSLACAFSWDRQAAKEQRKQTKLEPKGGTKVISKSWTILFTRKCVLKSMGCLKEFFCNN